MKSLALSLFLYRMILLKIKLKIILLITTLEDKFLSLEGPYIFESLNDIEGIKKFLR